MASGEQSRKPKPKEEEQKQAEETKAEAADTSDVDDLLDEIDSVLETNSEEFVKSFIQKGGQLVIPGVLAGVTFLSYGITSLA